MGCPIGFHRHLVEIRCGCHQFSGRVNGMVMMGLVGVAVFLQNKYIIMYPIAADLSRLSWTGFRQMELSHLDLLEESRLRSCHR